MLRSMHSMDLVDMISLDDYSVANEKSRSETDSNLYCSGSTNPIYQILLATIA